MKIETAKLTGNPGPSGWAQVHDFTPEEPEKVEKRGRLIAAMAIKKGEEGEKGLGSVLLGREVLSRIHEEYFGDLAPKPGEALKEAVAKVSSEFGQRFKEVGICALCLVGETAYLSGLNSRGYLLRDGVLGKLIDSTGQIVLASGVIGSGDSFLLATNDFFESVPEGVLKAALTSPGAEGTVEGVAGAVRNRPDSGEGVALAVIKVDGKPLFTPKPAPLPSSLVGLPKTPGRLRSTFAGLLDRIIGLLPERRIAVRGENPDFRVGKKGVAPLVGVILLLLLLVSIFFGLRQRTLREERGKYESRLTEARHEFDEAKEIKSLNATRARELIFSAKKTTDELLAEGVEDADLKLLVDEIGDNLGEIGGVYEVSSELFVDLSLLSSGFEGKELALSEGRLLILDKKGEKLAETTLATKKSRVVAGPSLLSGATGVAVYAERNFVVNEEGVAEIKSNTLDLVIEKEWEGEAWPMAYTGNLYLLDKENSEILRYAGFEGGFGSKQNWFGPGVNPNLTETRSWAVDGSFYLLGEKDRILKFTRGKPDAFSLSGFEEGVEGAAAIYTDDEVSELYLLEPTKARIVVFDKEGEYRAEYTTDKAREAFDFVVSESARKIILLTGPRLYSVELKHL